MYGTIHLSSAAVIAGSAIGASTSLLSVILKILRKENGVSYARMSTPNDAHAASHVG